MIKQLSLFAATFLLGAIIALAARTAIHEPHGSTESGTTTSHAGHAAASKPASPSTVGDPQVVSPTTSAAVNTVCAICGMKVDPKLPTLEYQGKKIAFGCRMCPPKFKANPDKYGPYYLRNEVMPK